MHRASTSIGRLAATLAALLLALLAPAAAQVGAGAPIAYLYCYSGTVPTAPTSWSPCSVTNPLVVSATLTPSGTQDVNLAKANNVALGSPSAYGTSPGAVNVLGVNAFVTNFPATQPVSGTVTANQGTAGSAWPVTLTSTTITGNTVVIGPTADGSPATTAPVLIGGTVDGSATGNVGVAKVDAAGLQYNANVNWGGTALGAMANYGTSPGAVLVPGVNAFVTNTVTVSGTVAATQSGTWTVQPGNTPNTSPWLVTSTPSSASGAALTPVSSSALAANTVIKASAGNLYSFEVSADSTLSAAAWWIMIYNATSAPVDGAVTPLKCYAMASGVTAFTAGFQTPVAFSTGITVGVSTTGCFTKTASTHAFISGDAQ